MSSKGEGGFAARHNFDAAKVTKIFEEEMTKILNASAEAMVGASTGKKSIGISSVFTKKSPPASKPGQPPGVRTGTLRRSFRTRAAKKQGKTFRVAAGTNVVYARVLEFGSDKRKIAARPFMKKGIASATPYIRKLTKTLGPKVRARCENEAGRPT